ncbi:hypothetical protein ID866_10407 [Astraeus odoratus]|nr:hypothetical protein ID866_10407 [Astraeus odoratus]
MHVAGAPILPLLYTVFQSIAQVFLLCVSGYYLACKGITDKRTEKVLNHVNVFLFTPALLFSKVAFFLTLGTSAQKLRELWVIPLFFVFISALSGLVANLLARILRLKPAQRNFATAASMFMNSNSLPIALMQSLVATVPGLKWGPDDDENAMFGRALTYLVVFSTLGMMLRWSYGVRLLARANEGSEGPREEAMSSPAAYHEEMDNAPTCVLADRSDAPTERLVHYDDDLDAGRAWASHDSHGCSHIASSTAQPHASFHVHHHPHPHQRHALHVPPAVIGDELTGSTPSQSPSDSELDTDSDETLASRGVTPRRSSCRLSHASYPSPTVVDTDEAQSFPASRSVTVNLHTTPLHRLGDVIRSFRPHHFHPCSIFRLVRRIPMPPPPLLASLLALLFTFPKLQEMLKSDAMVPVRGALESAGGCSVPITLVVLGGWFWEDDEKSAKDANKREHDGKVKREEEVPSVVVSESVEEADAAEDGARGDEDQEAQYTGARLHRRSLARESLDAPRRGRRAMREGCDSQDLSRSPSISSLFSVLQDLWKMRPMQRQGRGRGPIHLSDDDGPTGRVGAREDDMNDIEAGQPRCDWRMSSSSSLLDRQQGKQMDDLDDISHHSTEPEVAKNPPGETRAVIVTLLSRMIIVPLLVLPLMAYIKHQSEGNEGAYQVFDDPVFILASILLVASPPALTLAQITQKAASRKSKSSSASAAPASTSAGPPPPTRRDTSASTKSSSDTSSSPFERLLSRTVFWSYCVLTPPVTIVCVLVGMVIIAL